MRALFERTLRRFMENDFTWLARAEADPVDLHAAEDPPPTPPGYAARPHPDRDDAWRIVQLAEVPIVDVLVVDGRFATLDGVRSSERLADLIDGVTLFLIEGGAQ